nr:MAG TPA: hypothetical protein [Caudoviricetes sp.]
MSIIISFFTHYFTIYRRYIRYFLNRSSFIIE